MRSPASYPISELGLQLRSGALSCTQLTETVLADIKKRNLSLRAFSSILEERAREEAAQAQRDLDSGIDLGPLHGIPYAVKATFDVAGQPNDAGMQHPENTCAAADAEAIVLLRSCGAVLVGITHTSPLAATILGINHVCGTPHNPWKQDAYIPGGSSSGSAVAVAAGMVPFALGSDTGGSVRVPAALCGITGLKPTTGRISMQGVWPLAPTLDTPGIMSRSTADVKTVYEALAHVTDQPYRQPGTLRIGICKTVFFDDTDPEITEAVKHCTRILSRFVKETSFAELPPLKALRELMKETSLIASEAYPLHAALLSRPGNDWVLDWLHAAAGYSAQQAAHARERYAATRAALRLSDHHLDAIIVPTTPVPAVPVRNCDSPASHGSLSALFSRNTLMANLAGWCSISVPCTITANGLPAGLMICADAQQEAVILQLADILQNNLSSSFHAIHPPYAFIQ